MKFIKITKELYSVQDIENIVLAQLVKQGEIFVLKNLNPAHAFTLKDLECLVAFMTQIENTDA